MTHLEGERRIKALQKAFLLWAEEHPGLGALPDAEFNALRRRVFRGTFQAFRLGVVGIEEDTNLNLYFFRWLGDSDLYLGPSHQAEVSFHCFRTALEAFRLGALVSGTRTQEDANGAEVHHR